MHSISSWGQGEGENKGGRRFLLFFNCVQLGEATFTVKTIKCGNYFQDCSAYANVHVLGCDFKKWSKLTSLARTWIFCC